MKLNSSKPILTAARPAQRGIALVITLIMLSVTLIMAVAFLAVANRERATVTITSDGVNARLAADSALAAAQAQILANVLGSGGGLYNSSLIVSTNYIRDIGFIQNDVSPTNVNYDHLDNSSVPLNANDFETMVANLLYLPRAPVMLSTNELDGRFYLDLNRNGIFDPTATNIVFFNSNGLSNNVPVSEIGDPQWIGVLQRPDALHSADNQFIARYAFFAQPIGNGLDLNYIHNQTKTETVNSSPSTFASDGYFRNQGVGSWEINLAAFLTDLDANEWDPTVNPYIYQESGNPNVGDSGSPNKGAGFENALSLLSWRYGFNYSSLAGANAMFTNAANPFRVDNIDEYSDGPLQVTTANIVESTNIDVPTQPWAGADSTNRFFNLPAELFDPTKSSIDFVARLANAGTNTVLGQNPTDDRYAFYHLLQQLGTDSIADNDGKLDLNYDNTDGHGNLVRGVQTNLVPWTAMTFFTNAADRMLRMYTTNWFQSNPSNYLAMYYGIPGYNYFYIYTNSAGFGVVVTNDPTGFGLTNVPFFGMTNQIPAFGITDIPVYVNSNFVYSSAINRVLQLAANIYDASTNSFYPSVFRPLFGKDIFGNVFITGYTNLGLITVLPDFQLTTPVDITTIAAAPSTFSNGVANVYGVPWIIGAKKGFPNFNEFSFENNLAVTRRLQFTRIPAAPGGLPTLTGTNQMYEMGYTSSLGIELWNSYASNYNGSVTIDLNEIATVAITNDDINAPTPLFLKTINTNISISVGPWTGAGPNPWTAGNPNPLSFVIANPLGPVMTNSVYRSSAAFGNSALSLGYVVPGFIPTNAFDINTSPLLFESNSPTGFHFPQFGVLTTNRLQVYMLDFTNGAYHVIDYVHFSGPDSSYNLNTNLADLDDTSDEPFGTGVWDTNYDNSPAPNGLTYGILNQIKISEPRGVVPGEDGQWHADPNAVPLGGTVPQQQAYFLAFFSRGNRVLSLNTNTPGATNLDSSIDAPYSPTRYITQYITWQVNDPLVHYLVSDINFSGPTNDTTVPELGLNHYNAGDTIAPLTGLNLGKLNDRYSPWEGNPHYQSVDTNDFNLAVRDPLMMWSDNWDFPTNRYPTVGWLGRVHRGTPWQTVYLKSANILANANGTNTWQAVTGDGNAFDAVNDAPVQDARLFDIFTTALDDNASRGTLSINQPNLAAWSALLSGVVVMTNVTSFPNVLTPSPVYAPMVISPAGGDTTSAVWNIVNDRTNGINAIRANLAIFPGGVFTHVGDILRVPMLTHLSPFINTNSPSPGSPSMRLDYDISDEAYEQIPQQILGLLRVGSPRYVIYCYGQALRPAQDGVALDLTHNGLVTNYQVVAESAARAVISVHPQVIYRLPSPPVTNYTTTVENYTPLTPN